VFDANSNTGTGAFTVTVDGITATPSLCADLSTSSLDGAMTLAFGTVGTLSCFGSFTLPATNFAVTGTGTINFSSTTTGKTINANGVALTSISFVFNGVGGGWTLASAITNNGFFISNGSFNTGNFNITTGQFGSNYSTTRSITLGSSTISCSSTSGAWNLATTTGLTFSAGTSTISCINAGPTFNGGGLTYYNLTFASTSIGTSFINGTNTFNNVIFTARAAAGFGSCTISANQTINGTLTLGSGTTGVARLMLASDVIGTQRTLTCATIAASVTDIDFRDIALAGAFGSPLTGTRLGNCGNNAGITFTGARTVYWNSAASANWNAAVWSTASGSTGGTTTAFPLAQDSIVIDNAGLTTGNTITINANYNIPALSFATRSNAATFATGTTVPVLYGNYTLSSAITVSGTGILTFAGQGVTQALTSAAKTFTQPITINNATGIVQLQDNLTLSTTVTLTSGSLDLNNKILSTGFISSSNSNTRSILFGTGQIILTAGNTGTFLLDFTVANNFTYTGTSNIVSNYSTLATGTRDFRFGNTSGSTESNVLNFYITAGTDTVRFIGGFKTIDLTGFNGTWSVNNLSIYGNLVVSSGTTPSVSTTYVNFLATSGTQQITTANKTFDFNLYFNGIGGTVAFQDALTQGSTKAFIINNGTVKLKAGVTTTVGSFSATGSTQKYLQSTLAGSQATISQASGTINASYLTIQDIFATGGATWNALYTSGNIDAGNNTNWIFGESPSYGYEYTYRLRSFTQPRRF
jgi:hypothetical protein